MVRMYTTCRLSPLRSLKVLLVHIFLHQEGIFIVIITHRILLLIFALSLRLYFCLLSFKACLTVKHKIFIVLLRLLVFSQLISFLDHDFRTSLLAWDLSVNHFVAFRNRFQKLHDLLWLRLLVVSPFVFNYELLDDRFNMVVLLLG